MEIEVRPYGSTWYVTVGVKNTGNKTHTFVVGASVGAPGGGSGCDLWLNSPSKDLIIRKVALDPGKSVAVLWNFDDSDLASGTNWIVVKVWKDETFTTCLDGDYRAFTV